MLFIFLLKLFRFLLKLFMFLLKLFMLFQLLPLSPLKFELPPLNPMLPSRPIMKLPLGPFILKPLPLFKAAAVGASRKHTRVVESEFIIGS